MNYEDKLKEDGFEAEEFVVDASIIQELGERLVGRPAIALGELVKNSYDAEATTCRIEVRDDSIVILDDGTGMSRDDFKSYWLRLGTTHKVDERISKKLHRPFAGSKGVGRLAVQFLASEIEIESTTLDKPDECLSAKTDWEMVVRGNELDSVKVGWRTVPGRKTYLADKPHGTRITLRRLKDKWNAERLEDLGREVWKLRSPFRAYRRGESRSPDDFDIEVDAPSISGAREAFDGAIRALFANWKARIRGKLRQGRIHRKAEISIECPASGMVKPLAFRRSLQEARSADGRGQLRFSSQSAPTKPTSVGRRAREPLAFRRG